jgi:predicted AAA+ superfamily ATPase
MNPLSFLEYLVAAGYHLIAKTILDNPLGLTLDEMIHLKILDLVGEYLSTGGMPEAIASRY